MSVISQNFEVYGTYFSKSNIFGKITNFIPLDVTSSPDVKKTVTQLNPDVVVHLVGIPDPDVCEKEKTKAYALNVQGTQNIVKVCSAINAKLIFTSTNYVFDGKDSPYLETDKSNPLNFYGETKLEAEKIIQRNLTNYLIVRLPLLYGYNNKKDRITFATKVIKSLAKGERIYLDNHQFRYPTLIDDVANVISECINKRLKGIYHVSATERVTLYQFSFRIAQVWNFSTKNIGVSKNKIQIAKRPRDARLGSIRSELHHVKMNSLTEGLRLMKAQMGRD